MTTPQVVPCMINIQDEIAHNLYSINHCPFQVIMATKDGAEKACKEPNPIIDGRKANVNLAILGAKPRVNSIQGKCYKNRTIITYYSCTFKY